MGAMLHQVLVSPENDVRFLFQCGDPDSSSSESNSGSLEELINLQLFIEGGRHRHLTE